MRRAILLLAIVLVAIGATTAPSSAQPADQTVGVGETVWLRAGWGACYPGLAQAATKASVLEWSIDGVPIETQAAWSRPAALDHDPHPGWEPPPGSRGCMGATLSEYGYWSFWEYPIVFDVAGDFEVTRFWTITHAVTDGGDWDGDGKPDVIRKGTVWEDTFTVHVVAVADDLLTKIQDEGVIRVSTDPAFPPQSSLNPDTGEYEGFDIDVATEIANRLGVDIQWETPGWDLITAGHWQDGWDMSVGSMTVTAGRAEVLYFTPAYYYWPAKVVVHEDNTTIMDPTIDLDGRRIGVFEGGPGNLWLQGTLDYPGYPVEFLVEDPHIVTYETESMAIQDLAMGDGAVLDAAIVSTPSTLKGAIDEGMPIKLVGDPVFHEPLTVAFDRASPLDAQSLVDEVSQIIDEMHADGTLADLSMKWYGEDLTTT